MTEVAQYACLPGSTAYRLLKELVGCGLLDRGTDGHYHIGPAMYQLATDSYSPADEAQAHIGRILQDLEHVTGYRARYGVLRGHGVGYVERGDGPPDWLRRALAVRSPAHATAAGQALLAHAGAEVIERFIHRGCLVTHPASSDRGRAPPGVSVVRNVRSR